MPNRILKESICTSDSVNELSWFEEVLFYRLIVACDDYGRYDGRIAVIKNRLFPLKDKLTVQTVEAAIKKLASVELVVLYEYEGKPYLHLPTWNAHQTIRAKKSKYPAPEDGVKTSEIICKQMNANVPVIQSNPIQSESNTNTNIAQTGKRFSPPTLDEVKEFWSAHNFSSDPEGFWYWYDSNGWKQAKGNLLKSWTSAAHGWEKRQRSFDRPKTEPMIKGVSQYEKAYK